MGYGKLKTESYSNIGGINQKASTYVTGDKEVLDLENLDFQTPGAWSKRWGFTAAYASSASFSIGASQNINAIWQITSTAQVPDFIPTALFTTTFFGYDSGVAAISGSFTGATLRSWVASTTTAPTPYVWDSSEFIDATYYSNGVKGYKNKATDLSPFLFGMAVPPTIAFPNLSGLTFFSSTVGTNFSGTYAYQYAYLDHLGFVGAVGATFFLSSSGASSIGISGFTTTATGVTSALAYGATRYVIFRNRVPGFPSTDMISVGTIDLGSTVFVDTNVGPFNQYFYFPSSDLTTNSETTKSWNISEVFANRLWIDVALNTIAFSELENLQSFLSENVRIIASNNFRMTAFKAYNQSLMILCQKGIFRLTGDTPENFSVVNMSNEYGCVSDKSVVVFNEKMWFLDYESIIEFNGANFSNVGNRVESFLSRMNKSRAYRRACSQHYPDRNEVWFSIPIDNSDINNITLVYDYLVDGWTTFKGDKLKPTALGTVYENNVNAQSYVASVKSYLFGSIGGSLYKFGESFTSDNGTGITMSFTTRYHNELGKSQTAQFRRFYLDIGGYTGATLNFGLAFYANYSTVAISYTTSMNFNQWQDRIDFGIPAKSLSVKVAHGSTTGKFQINGYTMEFRFQRAV